MRKTIKKVNVSKRRVSGFSPPTDRCGFKNMFQCGGLDYSKEFVKAYRTVFILLGKRVNEPTVFKHLQALVEVLYGNIYVDFWSKTHNRSMLLEALERGHAAAVLYEKAKSDNVYWVRDWICHVQDILKQASLGEEANLNRNGKQLKLAA